MRKIIVALMFMWLAVAVKAQDTIVLPAIDSSLSGVDIFSLVKRSGPSGSGVVVINQSSSIVSGMHRHIISNSGKTINGYRVRIFFDNKQNARSRSAAIMSQFREDYPAIGVYREYENPYFKVTVGDFRTKMDAKKFLETIRYKYSSVFIDRKSVV